ncbi:MAG: hypothetical protein IK083_04610 [Abditibacteriota bacterium]|nr:hypothetical protein [Abditibacteriota bacterium]
MKRSIYLLLALAAAGVICCGSFPSAWGDSVPIMQTMTFSSIPYYLLDVYEESPYQSEIRSYTSKLDDAPIVYVNKSIESSPVNKPMTYMFRNTWEFLGYDKRRLSAFVSGLKLSETALVAGDFEFARYNVNEYTIPKELVGPAMLDYDLVVLRRDKDFVGYWCEPAVGSINYGKPDIRILDDGTVMTANAHAVRYFTKKEGRIVCECYFECNSYNHIGSKNVPIGGAPSVTILSDNLIRKTYNKGKVELCKVRLSEDDIAKNKEKWAAVYKQEDRDKKPVGADHVLWWNGVGKKRVATFYESEPYLHSMWCFREGGEEPSPQAVESINSLKPYGKLSALVSSTRQKAVPEKASQTPAVPAGRQSLTGLLARMFNKAKDFWTRMFA